AIAIAIIGLAFIIPATALIFLFEMIGAADSGQPIPLDVFFWLFSPLAELGISILFSVACLKKFSDGYFYTSIGLLLIALATFVADPLSTVIFALALHGTR
ncbi:MAG TPA: hypothetical protein VMU59_06275, partial [Caulobacteraceae bacterium]|nr:hypothetical protein [Caulobacteraceae bacterium]